MENPDKKEEEIYGKLARICSRSEECTPDIRKKIADWGGDPEMTDRIVARLQKEKYLDDARYVSAYTRDKFRLNKWGRIKIRYQLRMKGIPDEIIAVGLEKIDEDQYIKLLVKTMADKAKTVKKPNKFERMSQVIRFTQSRGFEPELIHRHINRVIS